MDDPFDGQLRIRLDNSIPAGPDARTAWNNLRPSFHRARRRRRAKQSAAALVLALGTFGLGVFVVDLRPSDEQTTIIAGLPDEMGGERLPSTTQPTDPAPTPEPTSAPTSTTEVPRVDSTSDGTSTPDPSPTITDQASAEPTAAGTSAPRPTTENSISTSSSDTTSASPTTTNQEHTVASPCGSIVVSTAGASVTLLEAMPNPGYVVDVKNSGPEKVEVSLERTGGHCEIEAEIRDGRLVTEIDDE